MIRFTLDEDHESGERVLLAEGRPARRGLDECIVSEPLTAATRAMQARHLVDAAALLIEDDDELAEAFERLHGALDLLPGSS